MTADALDTFPKMLLAHARTRGDRPAMREKDYGIWQSWSWAAVKSEVEALAGGLKGLGFARGDKLAIIGDNRPRLYWAIAATQALGGVPVPVYQDSIADEMAYVLDHAEVRFAIVEDQEQVDKLVQVRERCPRLETVIYDDQRGLRHYPQPWLHAYDRVREAGLALVGEQPDFFAGEIAQSGGADTAIILYTSGTTGRPKGVVLSFDNLISTAQAAIAFEGLTDREEVVAYLPMAWIGEHIFSYVQAYCAGFCVSCPEDGTTVMHDLRELGPSYLFAPPRIFENILTQVMIRMEDAAWLKRRIFDYFLAVARRAGLALLDRRSVAWRDRLLYWLGNLLVYGPLKNTLGFSRIRVAYTAGEAIGPDLFLFYRSLGVNLKSLYGMTESSVFLCIQRDGAARPDTVGAPIPGVEIKIAEDGEVLFRSPGAFQEYYKNPVATAEAKGPDGWVHTGDAGFFDESGQLTIVDRARDVGRLAGGALFAPKFIENKLKFFPYIKEAVAFGDGRDRVAAFINIDLEAVGNWAERRALAYASYQELAEHGAVYDLIAGCIEAANRDLAAQPSLAPSQIRRFLVLHKELDADDGELTRTRKVRRRIIAERYQSLVEALYSGARSGRIETEVTFEDGRRGTLRAELAIRDVVANLGERAAPVAETAEREAAAA
ncbi:MAG TPA: AMP-binding protein [Candidatus Dormibacteraeota bacterium]|nr:AMP-binding protein [Candidatus Dormibacteraeota bacterium]